jgi:hypothetical protein
MGETGSQRRMVRWAVWLGLGVILGLVLGFVVGLAKPRAQTPRIETI